MKKFHIYIIILSVFSLLLCSCREERTYRIGVSQCSADDWRSKINDEMEREIMFHSDASIEILSADDSNEKQIADIRSFKDRGFDIIIAAPNEAAAITPVIEEVYAAGIPVIIFDRNITGDSYTARIAVDNRGLGRMAAEYALQMLDDNPRAIEIFGLEGSTPAIERRDGFAEVFTAGGGVIAGAGVGRWNHDDAVHVADSLLDLYPDVDLIYAHNDRMAIGASEVARSKGLDNIKIIGIDAAPEIGIRAVADGIIDATFLYPTEGHLLVRLALDILEGHSYERETMLPLASAVDKSNADILLLQNESMHQGTDRMRQLKAQIDTYWERHSAQTSLFYAVIVILVLLFGVLFLVLRAYWQHRRHRQALEEQNILLQEERDNAKELNGRLQAATQSKLAFFTNVSHDLRTPLTLIAEPVEQLVDAGNLTERQKALMKIANKNVRILQRLINQILDFRKYDAGKLSAVLSEADFGALAREWLESFEGVARNRGIHLEADIPADADLHLAVDTEKMERVVFNLLSNSFKHTPANGTIRFSCRCEDENLVFSVSDTGSGIPPENLEKIFEHFYQADTIRPDGSGIGLWVSRSFVQLHGGTIDVESTPGKGSTFTVRIPVRHVEAAEIPPAQTSSSSAETELAYIELPVGDVDDSRPRLLVIDDNSDILLMLRELMGDDYNVITATNGREGLRLAAKYVPDLIICDVMMPHMDGLECLRHIKEEITTSHIPVLMLTACSLDEQRVQGYDAGADGYLAKPFNSAVLRARCTALIANRKRISRLWDGDRHPAAAPLPKNAGTVGPDIDNEFYRRFSELLRSRMSDPDLSVDTLAAEIGLERSQLYRKIKSLTNYSPVELVRHVRLTEAHSLLTATDKTISEIAYQVGFSSPAYFSKCYRDAFGETPSQLRSRLGASTS